MDSLSHVFAKKGAKVYFIGIKGTGMCALAELMHKRGFLISGSDRNEVFYTDGILKELGIPYFESFDASHIDSGDNSPDLIIYSAAYSFGTNAEMDEAQKRGIPIAKYTDALGAYSAGFDSCGITGVHGKTTTTALAGTLLRGTGIPAQVLAGSAVSSFGVGNFAAGKTAAGNLAARSTLDLGDKYFVAETCEYRRHFLSFHPNRIILTSVESDHQDYYPTYADIRDAFLEYCCLLPDNGELIYCADNPGATEVAFTLKNKKSGVKLIPYGFSAAGVYGIEKYEVINERIIMKLRGFADELILHIPGRHTALNAAGAIALVSLLVQKEYGSENSGSVYADGWNEERWKGLKKALEEFRGSKRRSEILGEAGGILFMDDYGHHPSAIKTTLEGLREFYPGRRLVVSFMSHTYTRTAALLEEFAASFEKADLIILHKIYSSAREVYHGGVSGRTLYEETKKYLAGVYGVPETEKRVLYVDEVEDAQDLLIDKLRKGDLFITMGAGDNWKLSKKLFEIYRDRELQ